MVPNWHAVTFEWVMKFRRAGLSSAEPWLFGLAIGEVAGSLGSYGLSLIDASAGPSSGPGPGTTNPSDARWSSTTSSGSALPLSELHDRSAAGPRPRHVPLER